MDKPIDFKIPLLQAFPPHIKGAQAFFTTRVGGQSLPPYGELNLGYRSGEETSVVTKNWKSVLNQFDCSPKQLRIPNLEHTDIICDAEQCNSTGTGMTADAVFTQNPQVVIAVTAADCLPILIFDSEKKTIAAIHSGWRGSAQKILQKTLSYLEAKKLILKKSTHICFGPHIHAKNYPIGEEVAQKFPQSCLSQNPPILYRLDLNEANRLQVLQFGIPEKNLFCIPHCTFEREDQFYSYRRDGVATGRTAAVIKLDSN